MATTSSPPQRAARARRALQFPCEDAWLMTAVPEHEVREQTSKSHTRYEPFLGMQDAVAIRAKGKAPGDLPLNGGDRSVVLHHVVDGSVLVLSPPYCQPPAQTSLLGAKVVDL